ncbi:MAG TPA: type IX secretion system membrane protein PorP/SprF [Bacteroidia bacterium]|jgi:type IX secretion system PorP/SprF family membrane protein|nr:type IX secretion system membrane protein PorP/SprF [Bacteroidia bacterium]
MKKHILAAFGALLSLGAMAQQDAGFSQYFFNPLYVNPAYAGSREAISGTLVYRNQWTAMDGAPVSQSFNIHGPVPNSKVGLGLQIYNDAAGPVKNTGVSGTYAYHIPIGKFKLSLGVQGSLNDLRILGDKITIDDKSDQAFTNNTTSYLVPDAGAGIYLYRSRFYAGLSATHLLQPHFGNPDASVNNTARFYRNYYLTSGVVFKLSDMLDLRPSILLKSIETAPMAADLNAALIFNEKFFVGLGYRTSKRINMDGTDNMLVAMLEYECNHRFRIGYSYDYYLNRTGTYNSAGTHEIMLGWDFEVSKTKMMNPRYF